ncbi:probable chitinase 10 [Limulus polyphemus]|uniref:Probable chitinase 10 n=1 Tax=Limulus polyphemus TaxID=6850 RepID=A0ABM1SIF4_LIMPO|nr:probable chitinase 10 [Limulus polyphemus]
MLFLLLLGVIPAYRAVFICPKDGLYPYQSDCSKFYHCAAGFPYLKSCPAGLFFNALVNACDWPENVECAESTSSTTSLTSPISTDSTTPESMTTYKPPPSGSNLFKIVCYFTNWAFYRPGIGKFLPEDIDPTLCTHINYAFAILDPSTMTLKPHDTWADLDNSFYKRVTSLKLKNPSLKVLLSIGGWTDSAGNKYSRLISSASLRQQFINHVVPFLKQYSFDGLDLDWEYPVCWQTQCENGPTADKLNFAKWVQELRKAFNEHHPRLLLTAAVSASKRIIDAAYDVGSLSRNLDFINIMSYDYSGSRDKATKHHSPLYYHQKDKDPDFNSNFSMNYWLHKGATPTKLVMGIPFYGRSFTLSNPSSSGLNAPVKGKGLPGTYTREGGFLSYYEICSRIKIQGWIKKTDPATGPYAYGMNQWVGYDDPASVARKAQYIIDKGFGGAMMWSLDLDDFKASCCKVRFPLLKTINYVLRGSPRNPSELGCE